MAALSPEKHSSGKKMFRLLAPRAPVVRPVVTGGLPIVRSRCRGDPVVANNPKHFSRRRLFALTPPARTMLLVSGYFSRAFSSFSSKISQAVCSKEAAKSATCCSDKRSFS